MIPLGTIPLTLPSPPPGARVLGFHPPRGTMIPRFLSPTRGRIKVHEFLSPSGERTKVRGHKERVQ
jgi:hypothetical protein